MKHHTTGQQFLYCISLTLSLLLVNCNSKPSSILQTDILNLKLKTGSLITCGPPAEQYGSVSFQTSLPKTLQADFDKGIAILHSFEYDESEKVFASIITKDPNAAMAYWGVAMSNYHPLWMPPTKPELEKGSAAITLAQKISSKTQREADYIDALASFYTGSDKESHATRSLAYEKAMEELHNKYADDKEAAIFYALALNGAADPTDKTLSKQRKAGKILNDLYLSGKDHPGIIHYIIHSFDSPELATTALEAARKYAAIAPSSAHAQHMPSHIFTRLGLWDEEIKSNKVSAESAKCYGESLGLNGHWDEELHALDYLMYGYLQKGDNNAAKETMKYAATIHEIQPANFKVAYSLAAIPSRYFLENKQWKEATTLQMQKTNFAWAKYPWQASIIHFTRTIALAQLGKLTEAKEELKIMNALRDSLLTQKDEYKANQVQIQIYSADAWIQLRAGKKEEALKLMQQATDMEDKTQKHPVTPGEVVPAKELLGEMLLVLEQPVDALKAFEASLIDHPNRFNGLYGAGVAAEKAKDAVKAKTYFEQLLRISAPDSDREEIKYAKRSLRY